MKNSTKILFVIAAIAVVIYIIDVKPWRDDSSNLSNVSNQGTEEVIKNTYKKNFGNTNPVPNKNNNKTQTDEENKYLCSWCNGSGTCKECGGSGKNDADSVVLKSMGCTLCEKSGKCAKCGGDGYASY